MVPEGATLLPLVFRSKGTSENTRSLLHAWGYYVVEKQTSAPLLFAHSRSFALMYREPPDTQFNHLVLESFAPVDGDIGLDVRSASLGRRGHPGLRRRVARALERSSGPPPSRASTTCSSGARRPR